MCAIPTELITYLSVIPIEFITYLSAIPTELISYLSSPSMRIDFLLLFQECIDLEIRIFWKYMF